MEKESKETQMTAEELRNRLYHSLRERGLVDSVKSQLRNSLVSELQQSAKGKLSLRDLRVPEEGSILHRAANSLIADHLRRCQYDYTLSVFLPETGIAQDKVFSTTDLLKLMNISPQSHLYKKLASSTSEHARKGFLWQFLCEVSALHAKPRHDNGIQADLTKPPGTIGSLDSKFQDVDELFFSRREEHHKSGSMAMEERLLLFQRQQEERYRSDLKLEVARIKENEIARIRMEEKEKSRQENDRCRKELERTYQSKFDALVQRERNSIERLQREQELHEKEIYAQRQTLLGEIEALRLREAEVRREGEVILREKKLEDDRRKAWEHQLRSRENEVKRNEMQFDERLTNSMTKFRLEQQSKYLERTQNLDAREIKLKEDERRVGEDKDKMQSLKDELRDKTSRVNDLETILQELRHKEVSGTRQNEFLNSKIRDMADYSSLKEQNLVYRNELETLRNRMAELLQLNERMPERTKQEDLIRDIRRPTPEMLMMQRDLEKAREDAKDEKALSEHQKQQMDKRLREELDRNRDLLNRFEEQTLQMRDMNREVVDLKQQLSVTHQALSNEVYRKPHSAEDRNSSLVTSQRREIISEEAEEVLNRSTRLFRDHMVSGRRPQTTRYDDNNVYNDVDLGLNLKPTETKSYYQDLSDEVSSSASADIVAEAKYRLKSLEREAQNLESAYMNFHYQMTNVAAIPADPEPVSSRSQELSAHRSRSAASSQHHAPPPEASPIRRPVSSTPYTEKQVSLTGHDDSLHELKALSSQRSDKKQPPPQFNISNLSDDDIRDVTAGSVDERVEKPRPITVEDLEARPGSPSIVVVPGEPSSAQTTPSDPVVPSNGRQKKQAGSDLFSDKFYSSPPPRLDPLSADHAHTVLPHPRLPPLSLTKGENPDQPVESENLLDLDDAQPPQKQEQLPPRLPPLSLDSAWTSKPAMSLDAAWKGEPDKGEREQQSEDIEDWEEKRRLKEEERKKLEQEAWEREQRELEKLQGMQAVGGDGFDRREAKSEATDDGIDPYVKEYMQKIQQEKLKKQKTIQDDDSIGLDTDQSKSPIQSDHDISLSEEVHSLQTRSDNSW
ncbi:hypothetical protein ScPMuIL_011472 [Solemya velum]